MAVMGLAVSPSKTSAFTPNMDHIAQSFSRVLTVESSIDNTTPTTASSKGTSTVGYQALYPNLQTWDVTVPVAMWFPPAIPTSAPDAVYSHRIFIKKIGILLLANLNSIPAL